MLKTNNQQKFIDFRARFPYFVYEKFEYLYGEEELSVRYFFNLAGKYMFRPTLRIPRRSFYKNEIPAEYLENILFQTGLMELISYWKAACPPRIIIKNFMLSESQQGWWKKLFVHGLGEFFFLNGISVDEADFIEFETGQNPLSAFSLHVDESCIIPVGGGKDSAVTIEMLGRINGNVPFMLNPGKASLETIGETGFSPEQSIIVHRTIDPQLPELNQMGFLNGHTPFSALLAFITSLTAIMSGKKYIALSNESSANESTIPGTKINHQYSKSLEFETDFRNYLADNVTKDINYFSFLRPLSELRIARLFSEFPNYFIGFRSCNVGSKTNIWCGKCSKCLFTYIILSPFINREKLEKIFGKNLLEDESLLPLLEELTGIADEKPFDCVGTIDEVNIALVRAIDQLKDGEFPFLLKFYKGSGKYGLYKKYSFSDRVKEYDLHHHLPTEFEELLKSRLND